MKFIIYILTPILTILLLVIKIEFFEKLIIAIDPDAPLYLTIALVLGSLYVYYINFASPYKKLQTISEKRWDALKKITDSLFKEYKQYGLSFNIMIPRRKYFRLMEPKTPGSKERKFQFGVEVFEVIWTYGNSGVHKDFKLTVNQGLCGSAYKSGVKTSLAYIHGIALNSAQLGNYNLTSDQIEKTKKLIIVVSCPISIEQKSAKDLKDKVVGILNVESNNEASESLVTDVIKQAEFYEKIVYLADIYSRLHI